MVSYKLAVPELPTVAEVLEFPVLKRGDPVVVAGARGTERRVRWVHVSEIADIGALLHGGEMILSTGVALPNQANDLAVYVRNLADANVAALVIGLGPRFREPLPRAMLHEADLRNLPLIALRRKTAFVDVTEEVHAALVNEQMRELQSSETIHVIFGDLALQGGSPETVLRQAARLSGFAVVLENLSHQILNFDVADRESSDVLGEWAQFTRLAPETTRTTYDSQTGWLSTTVGARGQIWGRLIFMTGSAGDRTAVQGIDPMLTLPASLVMLAERAASTVALVRLVDRDRQVSELDVHRGLISALLAPDALGRDVEEEAAALGVPLRGHDLLAFAMRASSSEPDPRERQSALMRTHAVVSNLLRSMARPALIGTIDDDTVGVLIPLPPDIDAATTERQILVGMRVAGEQVIIATAPAEPGIRNARIMLREAVDVARTAAFVGMPAGLVRSKDLGVRGLIFAYKDEVAFQRYAESQIGVLIDFDQHNDTNLVGVLQHYLAAGRNKTAAAKQAFVSRPWIYEQLKRIGQILGVDLEDEEICMSLQFALLIYQLQKDSRPEHYDQGRNT